MPDVPDPSTCEQCVHLNCRSLHDSSCDPSACPSPSSCKICPSLAELEAELLLVQRHLVELSTKRRSLKSLLNQHHDPLTRFPTELVSEIFQFYSADRTANPQIRDSSPAPLVLGGVCKGWRDVTLQTPELWSSVKIGIHPDFNRPYDIETATEWLLRSWSLPLSLDILFSDQGSPINVGSYTKNWGVSSVIPLLRSHSSRWENVLIDTELYDPSELLLALFSNLENPPSNLKTFEIHANFHALRFHKYYIEKPQPLLFPKRLKALWGSSTIGLPLGWDRLMSLVVSKSLYSKELLQIIQRAPNLVECSISSTICYTAEQSDLPNSLGVNFPRCPVISLSLTSLHIDTLFHPESANFLIDLTLPSLQSLHYVYHSQSTYPTEMNTLISFLERSSPPLKEFSLSVKPKDATATVDIPYDQLPSITTLEFWTTGMECTNLREKAKLTSEFLSLFSRALDGVRLPKLPTIALHVPILTPWFWSAFCNLFRQPRLVEDMRAMSSNQRGEAPETPSRHLLKTFRIYQPGRTSAEVSMNPSDFVRLVEIVGDGIEILLGDRSSSYSLSKATNTPP